MGGFEKLLIWSILLVGLVTPWISAKKTVVCYMTAWAITRPNEGRFSVIDADTEHCTHLIYAFMGLDGGEIASIDHDIDAQQLNKLKELKKVNPEVKVLVSIGGYNEKGRKFSDVASDPDKRYKFIKSVLTFLKQYELDGLDICWQFPGQRGGRPSDKKNSVKLFQEIKDAFDSHHYLLTVHILGKRYIIDEYDIPAISEIVDFINFPAVEYSGPWERTTGVMAPLRSKNQLNVQFSVDYILKKGAAPEKLMLGLPLYGHAYILEEKPSPDHLIGLFSNKTFPGPWTNEGGVTAFVETCHKFKHVPGWREVWDEESQTPLAFKDTYFISYDNQKSLLLKAGLILSRHLGGVMFWSIDMDDFRGLCFDKSYPLVTAVSDYINGDIEGKIDTRHAQPPPQTADEPTTRTSRAVGSTVATDGKPGSVARDEGNERTANDELPGDGTGPLSREERAVSGGPKTVVCYIVAWSATRPGAGKFTPLLADTEHCTHAIYAFMHMDESTYKIKSANPNIDETELPKLKELKKMNPDIKVLASVGGWLQGSKRFSNMAESADRRKTFIRSVMEFIREHQLDGIDICWQFPTQRGGKPEDKENSLQLFKELKTAFRADDYILTVHVLGQEHIINSYKIKEVSDVVDFINFAAMEYHGPWETVVNPTTPLFSSDNSNVRRNVDYILSKGVPPSKLLLGLPTYGHAYSLAEPPRGKYLGIFYDHKTTSQWTNEPGLIGYNELCYEMKNNDGWNEHWEELSATPLAYQGNQLVSLENERSLKLKAKLVHDKNLAGVMIWSLDMDDFRGLCHDKKYPLVTAIVESINKNQPYLRPQPQPPSDGSDKEPNSTSGQKESTSIVSHEYGKRRRRSPKFHKN